MRVCASLTCSAAPRKPGCRLITSRVGPVQQVEQVLAEPGITSKVVITVWSRAPRDAGHGTPPSAGNLAEPHRGFRRQAGHVGFRRDRLEPGSTRPGGAKRRLTSRTPTLSIRTTPPAARRGRARRGHRARGGPRRDRRRRGAADHRRDARRRVVARRSATGGPACGRSATSRPCRPARPGGDRARAAGRAPPSAAR